MKSRITAKFHLLAMVAPLMLLPACSSEEQVAKAGQAVTEPAPQVAVDLSPAAWTPSVLEAYQESMKGVPLEATLAAKGLTLTETGSQGIVASTSGAFVVHAGIEALKRGGNAMDALLVTTLTQPALHMGGATSYAGHGGFLYFEAETGKVYNVNSSYATTLGEADPMSIPPYGTPSGRAVLVPGFMAGVETAHSC